MQLSTLIISWCHTPEMQAVWKYMAKVLGWVDAALVLFPLKTKLLSMLHFLTHISFD